MRLDVLAAMLGLGWVTGFIGVGGAASVLAVLTTVFHVPVHVVLGTSIGAYLGSKCTRRVPPGILRMSVVAWPVLTGGLLIFA